MVDDIVVEKGRAMDHLGHRCQDHRLGIGDCSEWGQGEDQLGSVPGTPRLAQDQLEDLL